MARNKHFKRRRLHGYRLSPPDIKKTKAIDYTNMRTDSLSN